MKLVGEAVKEDNLETDFKLLGIATWDTVSEQDKVKLKSGSENHVVHYHSLNSTTSNQTNSNKEELKFTLNPYHNYSILYDDGSNKTLSRAIKFRSKLEEKIKSKLKIPSVLIAINGGSGTLKSVVSTLEEKIPVILLEGTSRATGAIIEAMKHHFDKLTASGNKLISDILEDSFRKENFSKKKDDMIEDIKYICDPTKSNLINVLSLKKDKDFEQILFDSISKGM
jgi:hypothetical protein